MLPGDIDSLVRPNIRVLAPYRCARDDYSEGILLDANENALGPACLAVATGEQSEEESGFNRYSDPLTRRAKSLYATWRGLPGIDWVFFGVGSDEAIDILMRVYAIPGQHKILICPPTYGMYSVAAAINDLGVVKVPLDVQDGRFQLQVDQVLETVRQDAAIRLMFLCSPGNPTGVCLNKQDLQRILDSDYHGLVVVDEAYIDFVSETADKGSVVSWVQQYPNLVVLQTMSKSFGMAAIRLGMAVSTPRVIHWLNATKAPYNISSPTALLAERALSAEGRARMHEQAQQLIAERARLSTDLLTLPGVLRVMGNQDANFLLCVISAHDSQQPDSGRAERIYRWMANHGVVVRYRGNELGCTGCLRITIGTPDENKHLLALLQQALDNTLLDG